MLKLVLQDLGCSAETKVLRRWTTEPEDPGLIQMVTER